MAQLKNTVNPGSVRPVRKFRKLQRVIYKKSLTSCFGLYEKVQMHFAQKGLGCFFCNNREQKTPWTNAVNVGSRCR